MDSNITEFFKILEEFNIIPKYVNNITDGILIEFETEKGFFILDYTIDDIAFLFRNKYDKRWVYDIERSDFIEKITDVLIEHK